VTLSARGRVMSVVGIKTYHRTNLCVTPTARLHKHLPPLSLLPQPSHFSTGDIVIRKSKAGAWRRSPRSRHAPAFDFLTPRSSELPGCDGEQISDMKCASPPGCSVCVCVCVCVSSEQIRELSCTDARAAGACAACSGTRQPSRRRGGRRRCCHSSS